MCFSLVDMKVEKKNHAAYAISSDSLVNLSFADGKVVDQYVPFEKNAGRSSMLLVRDGILAIAASSSVNFWRTQHREQASQDLSVGEVHVSSPSLARMLTAF